MVEKCTRMSKRAQKCCFLERAARACIGKQSRNEADHDLDTTLVQAPGLSSSLPTVAFMQPEHQLPAEHSESELSSSDSPSSNDEPPSDEWMQEILDDFMVGLSTVEGKTLAVLLMYSFKVRQNMKVTNAALESGLITGFNDQTVRQYHKQFIENKGKFPETKQGRYIRMCLLNDEELFLEAAMWVRTNAYKKEEANMTAVAFVSGSMMNCFHRIIYHQSFLILFPCVQLCVGFTN